MKKNEQGFGLSVVLLILLLLALIGFIYWRVSEADKKIESKQITNFAECKAAGNPIMESYPEQCAANGQTFTNPDQQVQSQTEPTQLDDTQDWLLYTSSEGTYSVRIPDGWDMETIEDTEHLFGGRTVALLFKPGTKAVVKTVEGGWDGASPFSLIVPERSSDLPVKEGTLDSTITTTEGLQAEKYIYTQLTEPDGIGYAKGSKVYTYYFGADGKYLQVQHVVTEGDTDQSALLEKMLKTLQVK